MSDTQSSRKGTLRGTYRAMWSGGVLAPLVLVVICIGVGYTQMSFVDSSKDQLEVEFFTVSRGSMTISETESGLLRSTVVEILNSEVEGETTIISLIEEGAYVRKGDLLVELDSSQFQDQQIDAQIRAQNAKAALIQASERLKILEQEALTKVLASEVALKLAELDLSKYQSAGGEYEQSRQNAEAAITIAENKLKTAEDRHVWSKKLKDDGYITEQDLKQDQLVLVEAQLKLRTAQDELGLLKQYSRARVIEQLESDLKQAVYALEQDRHATQSNIVDAKANLFAREAMYEREQEKLAKSVRQIEACRITAPVDGMVVHATSVRGKGGRGGGGKAGGGGGSGGGGGGGKAGGGGDSGGGGGKDSQTLSEGVTVRQRQPLIRLPATQGGMTVDVMIHESVIDKVFKGMEVRITTEALPGRVYRGRLDRIAPLPDAASAFLNPNLKVYNSEVVITGDTEGLRPGMSCRAEMLIDFYDDAVFVPVQTVLRKGKEKVVYIKTLEGSEERVVETGQDNKRIIHIVSGLRGGEVILMAPPRPAPIELSWNTSMFSPEDIEKAKMAGTKTGQQAKRIEGQGQRRGPGTGPGGGGGGGREGRGGDGGEGRGGGGRERRGGDGGEGRGGGGGGGGTGSGGDQ